MTDPTPAPADPNFGVGGSYIREPDGTLTRVETIPAPEKAGKPAAKPPVKEI